MAGRSESLQVFVRVRPPISKEVKRETAVYIPNTSTVKLVSESKVIECSYDTVFNEVSEQSKVFEKVKPLLIDVLGGVNSCIFAYGMTSSGKSYTMIGPDGGQNVSTQQKDNWGILPRASEFLLGYLNDKAEEGLLTYEVKASFLQIYNENLYDLLRDSGPMIEDKLLLNEKENDLRIREVPARNKGRDTSNEVFVSGLSEFRVQTSEDILRILQVGTNNRMTRSTDFNATSSRSHALLQLTFDIETQLESGQTLISRSKLNLVDLAGSEKIPFVSNDQANPKHMKELTSINKSLLCLGNVIAALSANNRSHIPYRDSKLTRILQDSLSGNTRTILIACVAPTVLHSAETLSTLQFADRAKNIMLVVKANTVVDDKMMLAKAQAEIVRLKALLSHALRQVETHNSVDGSNAIAADMDRMSKENEGLKRDNAFLRKQIKQIQQQAQQGQIQQEIQNKENYQDDSDSDQLISQSLSPLNPIISPKKVKSTVKNKSDPSNKNNFSNKNKQLLDTKILVDVRASGGTKKSSKVAGSGKKTKSRNTTANALGVLDSIISGNGGLKSKDKKTSESTSKLHSILFKSINDKQIEELNLRLAHASDKLVMEQQRQQQIMEQTILQQQKYLRNFPHLQNAQLPQLYGIPTNLNPNNAYQPPFSSSSRKTPSAPLQSNRTENDFQKALQDQQDQHMQMWKEQQRQQVQQFQSQRQEIQSVPMQQTSREENSLDLLNHQNKPSVNTPQKFTPPLIEREESFSRMVFGRKQQEQEKENSKQTINPTFSQDTEEADKFNSDWNKNQKSNNGKTTPPMRQPKRTFSKRFPSNSTLDGDPETNGGDATPPDLEEEEPMPPNRIYRKHPSFRNNDSNNGRYDISSSVMSTHGNNSRFVNNIRNNPMASSHLYNNTSKSKNNEENSSKSSDNNNSNSNSTDSSSDKMEFKVNVEPKAVIPSGAHVAGAFYVSTSPIKQGTEAPKLSAALNLSGSKDDIGTYVELFSFRMNDWEKLELLDYESSKGLYKCQYTDGTTQWLDFNKKPVRAVQN